MMVTVDADKLRSVNGQIEYILRQAVAAVANRMAANNSRPPPGNSAPAPIVVPVANGIQPE